MPRQVHLYCARDEPTGALLVQGPNASNPLKDLSCIQDEVLQIVAHDLRRTVGAVSPSAVYQEKPFSYASGMRAEVGLIDQPPVSGTFKLRVAGQTTGALTWPTDLSTPELLATWKASILTALKALSNVDDDAIVSDDTADTPVHLFNLRWTDVTRVDPVEVVENKLVPKAESVLTPDYPSQELKLCLFPFKETTDFASPDPPSATITSTRTGATGTNAEQTLAVPLSAIGSLALSWSGSSTTNLGVATLTDTALAAALNAIVTDGTSNPSFKVTERAPINDTRRFAIEFIGPLAGAPQALLTRAMYDQLARPYVLATLDLRKNPAIERLLAAQPKITITFCLTIDEEEKYQLPLTITNSLSGPDTLSDIAAAGAIIQVQNTVYVDSGLGDPFLTSAPGIEFTPTVGGTDPYSFAHDLGTRRPTVEIWKLIDDSPETWVQLSDNEWERPESIDVDHVIVQFYDTLSNTPGDPLYFGNFRIKIISPETSLNLFAHEHTWAQVKQTLPSGQTVAEKFAALDTVLGVFGGTLRVDARNIIGTLSSTQIDITSVATALTTNSAFNTTFQTLLSSAQSITTISNGLTNSLAFTTALLAQFQNSSLISQLATSLEQSAIFRDLIRSQVFEVIQGGAVPNGTVFIALDPFKAIVPRYEEYDGPTETQTVIQTTLTRSTDPQGNPVETSQLTPVVITVPTKLRLFFPLSPAKFGITFASAISTGILPTSPSESVYYVITTVAAKTIVALNGRPNVQTFLPGAIVTCQTGHWYEIVTVGADDRWFPKECEMELARLAVSAAQMSAEGGAEFALTLPLTAALLSDARQAQGRALLIFELGNRYFSNGLLDHITWFSIYTEELTLAAATLAVSYNVAITRDAEGSFADSTITVAGKSTALAIDKLLGSFDTLEETTFTADATTNKLTIAYPPAAAVGDRFVFESEGTLPAPLVTGQQYFLFAVFVDHTIQICESPSDVAALDITDAGDNYAAYVTFTVDTGTELITTDSAHGLTAGTIVRFTSDGTLPAGLTAGTNYYVIASGLTATDFKASLTLGGSAVNITDDGTGTHSVAHHIDHHCAHLRALDLSSFDLRVRLSAFDVDDTSPPAGALVIERPKTSATIIAL